MIEQNLNDINVGEKVLVGDSYLREEDLVYTRIMTVKKITPTGQFRLEETDTKFDSDGYEICSNRGARYNWGRKYDRIYKLTEELKEKRNKQIVEKKTIREAVELMNKCKPNYETALKIIDLLDGKEQIDE